MGIWLGVLAIGCGLVAGAALLAFGGAAVLSGPLRLGLDLRNGWSLLGMPLIGRVSEWFTATLLFSGVWILFFGDSTISWTTWGGAVFVLLLIVLAFGFASKPDARSTREIFGAVRWSQVVGVSLSAVLVCVSAHFGLRRLYLSPWTSAFQTSAVPADPSVDISNLVVGAALIGLVLSIKLVAAWNAIEDTQARSRASARWIRGAIPLIVTLCLFAWAVRRGLSVAYCVGPEVENGCPNLQFASPPNIVVASVTIPFALFAAASHWVLSAARHLPSADSGAVS